MPATTEAAPTAPARPRTPPPRRAAGPRRDDSGSSTVELVFVMPVVLTLILLIAQVTVWWHATHVAQAAAAQALAEARAEGGSIAVGQATAGETLDQLGRGPLDDAQITVTRDNGRATVRVIGAASSVVPFLHLPVHGEAAGPIEEFRAP